MSETHGKFIWCELMSPDIAASRAFYGSVVGWTTSEMQLPDLPPYTIFEADGRGVAGLMDFPAELKGKLPPNWTGYVAVDDVDRTAREVTENGGRVQREPDDIPGVGRFAVIADPHGAVLCIMKPQPMGDPQPPLPMTTPGHVGWHELMAGNGEEAFAFYSKLFGWTKHHDFEMGGMGVYRIFAETSGGEQAGGIMTKPNDVPVPCWNYYFNVPGIDAAIDRLTAGGGKVVNGPMEVPGGSWIVQAMDPQGAFFCLVAPQR